MHVGVEADERLENEEPCMENMQEEPCTGNRQEDFSSHVSETPQGSRRENDDAAGDLVTNDFIEDTPTKSGPNCNSGAHVNPLDSGLSYVTLRAKDKHKRIMKGGDTGPIFRTSDLNVGEDSDPFSLEEIIQRITKHRQGETEAQNGDDGVQDSSGRFRPPDQDQSNAPNDGNRQRIFEGEVEDTIRAGFLEYRMTGGKFTYISDNSIIKFSKLDKIFVCDLFLKKWPFATLKVLWRGWSDHCPVTLVCEALDFGPIPFKLYNSWIGSKDLEDIVIANINLQSREGKGDVELAKVLKNIKLDIKKWRDRVKVQEEKEVADLNKEAERLEKLAESTNLNAEERKLRVSIRVKLKKLESARIKYLHQKSRLNWIKYGDENTKFFHAVVNLNKSRSRINGLNVNGVWVTEPKVIKENIRRWFKKHFNESIRRRPTFSNLGLPSISAEESETLVMAFSEDENKNSSQGVRWK
ncbi:hypothetical protein HanLR1_Chr01g0030711 [Helianthus annuus]|nr:hypothetical protein HanLR1_Chr01g0030711 [Helianthus annuus]